MQYFKIVPLKKVLNNFLGKEKCVRYLQGVDTEGVDKATYQNSTNIYQDALSHLYSGDMEKAINYVIFGLDIDRNNKLLFNLCKNMTFLLSKHLAENNAETYRQKYDPSLDKAVSVLNKKLKELQKKLEFENSSLTNVNMEVDRSKPTSFFTFTKPYTIYLLKKRNADKNTKIIQANIQEYSKKFNLYSNDLDEIEGFVQVEEDVKVLGIIMEVCVLPSKYEWLATKSEKKAENVS